MAYDGIAWQKLELPFSAGLNQKTDDRARPQPFLDICRDVQFVPGGMETRYPFAAAAGAIFGDGTIANARRIERFGNEAVLFTKDTVYSWNATLSKWVSRSTHLAVAVDEQRRFSTTGDQIDGDRAELNGTVIYTWMEGVAGVFIAALDKTTGAVLMSPRSIGGLTTRARIVAATTKFHFFYVFTGSLFVGAIDPADPSASLDLGFATVTAASGPYDVVKIEGQDGVVGASQRTPSTAYTAWTVMSSGAINPITKARTCSGPIAVSSLPGTGTQVQVIRDDGTNLRGDVLTTSTLADVTTAQNIGSGAVAQVTACHRSVQTGGAFRCYVFWSYEATTTSSGVSQFNFVDSAGTIGTAANFIRQLGIASRAFDYNGSVFVWLAFAGVTTFNGVAAFAIPAFALQNTYFLYRDDTTLHAKSIAARAGGFSATGGRLSGVALTSGSTVYSWCGTERRRIELAGDGRGFAARAPVDVTFEFDANRARRCARLGSSLYVSGGEILQFDGTRLVEVGFHIYPWIFSMIDSAAGGSVGVGTYAFKITWRYQNGQGETDRSTTATIGQVTVTGNAVDFPVPIAPLTVTHKIAVPPAVEVWRTAVAPSSESPFYLVSSNDPTVLTNPNRYLPNDPTLANIPNFKDFLSDANATIRETNPENGAVLENIAPPPATIIFATDTRLFLLDVAGDPDRGWYSKLRGAGEVAAFNDVLVFDVPRAGGPITSGWFDADGVLYVARQTAIYAFAGPGLDNLGQGQNYTLVRTISEDVGVVNHESVALTPMGVIFKSLKGWQLLAGGSPQYIGDKVSDFDGEAVLAVHVVEAHQRVHVLTESRLIIWFYDVNQWGEWTVTDGVHACVFGGAYVYLAATGTRTQLATYTGLTYGLDVETTFIKLAELQGATRVRMMQALGEYRSAHLLRARVSYDYNSAYVDDKLWTPIPDTVGGPLQVGIRPKRPRCESIKLRLTAVSSTTAVTATLATAGDEMFPDVVTSGTIWTATLSAAALVGEAGNALTVSIAFEDGTPFTIDILPHFAWSIVDQRWVPAVNNTGLRVVCRTGSSPTVAQLEAAFSSMSAESQLVIVSTPDATPSKVVNATSMAGVVVEGTLTGGSYSAPTGEAIKLTSLGLEVGAEPGLYRRLPAAQKA